MFIIKSRSDFLLYRDSYNDLDMFEKADHAYTFNRVEKQIKEKTEKQVDYVYEVINDMLEGE